MLNPKPNFPLWPEFLARAIAIAGTMCLGTAISYIFQFKIDDGLTVWQWLRLFDEQGIFPLFMSIIGLVTVGLLTLILFWIGAGPNSFQPLPKRPRTYTERLRDEFLFRIGFKP